jgi:hypothetical protein
VLGSVAPEFQERLSAAGVGRVPFLDFPLHCPEHEPFTRRGEVVLAKALVREGSVTQSMSVIDQDGSDDLADDRPRVERIGIVVRRPCSDGSPECRPVERVEPVAFCRRAEGGMTCLLEFAGDASVGYVCAVRDVGIVQGFPADARGVEVPSGERRDVGSALLAGIERSVQVIEVRRRGLRTG